MRELVSAANDLRPLENFLADSVDSGRASIVVDSGVSDQEYSDLSRTLAQNDMTSGVGTMPSPVPIDTPKHPTEWHRVTMEFRYPQLPPRGGMSIFGLISNLTLNAAGGELSIGSKTYRVVPPASAVSTSGNWRQAMV